MRIVAVALAVCCPIFVSGAQTSTAVKPESTVIITLGTGTPRPLPDVMGPATAVVVGGKVFLFDAGEGIERRLAAAHLPINGVNALFLTHLHSDHILGVADLVLTSWIFGRNEPFPVFGPAGTKAMLDNLYAAFAEDSKEREIDFGAAGGYRVAAHEILPGVVYDSGGVRVTAFPVEHGRLQAYGYRIDTPTRSIVISGDTRPSETLIRMATGVDVLIHEVQSSEPVQLGNRPNVDWAKYIASHHTTSIQLGELAARAKPKLLIVSHNGRREPTAQLIANIQKAFSGKVVVAEDLQRF
jgi:ribonuclease BN (tRNA processing enzyme)